MRFNARFWTIWSRLWAWNCTHDKLMLLIRRRSLAPLRWNVGGIKMQIWVSLLVFFYFKGNALGLHSALQFVQNQPTSGNDVYSAPYGHLAEPEQYHIKSMSVRLKRSRNHHSNGAMSYLPTDRIFFPSSGVGSSMALIFALSHRREMDQGSRLWNSASLAPLDFCVAREC